MSFFNHIFNRGFILYALLAALLISLLNQLLARRFFYVVQSTGYRPREYLSWVNKRGRVYLKRLAIIPIIGFLAHALALLLERFFGDKIISFNGIIFYALSVIGFFVTDIKHKAKSRVVLTARLKRVYVCFVIMLFTFSLLLILGVEAIAFYSLKPAQYFKLRLIAFLPLPIFVPYILLVAAAVLLPFENMHNNKYIKKCARTLREAQGLIKIGITGSFAKTSVKEILNTILSVKYKALATPRSYNTPMGVCKCVSLYDGTQDVFICEMGARYVGDIKELADMVLPDCAIITGVTNQHLETFGTLDSIVKTKYELIEGLKEGAWAVFSTDNEFSRRMYDTCNAQGKITPFLGGVQKSVDDGQGVYASDIVTDKNGTSFKLVCFGRVIECKTRLVGRHNVTNICLAAAVASKLGLSDEQIGLGISLLKPVKHRLEVYDNGKGMTIIDDSYNSNVEGTIAALELLATLSGRKIIITPGLVELGKMEDIENYRLGKRIASAADYAILVGQLNCYKLQSGLVDAGFDAQKIKIVKDLKEGVKHLESITRDGDIVLFENDLPDKFS